MEGIWQAIGAAALGAAAAVSFFVFPVATPYLASAALSLGASYISTVLAPEAAAESAVPGGTSFEVELGGDVPRQVAIGTVGTAGQLVHVNTYTVAGGQPNTHLQLVFALSDSICDGLDYVWVDGRRKALNSVAVTGTEAARYEVADYGSDFIVRWFEGSYGQTADTELTANASPAGRWSNNHRGRGVCYVSCTLIYDEKKFKNGMPDLFWQLRGARLYDSRFDSTNGGTGTQRFTDRTTWVYSANPAVAAYHYRRGIYVNNQRIIGMDMPSTDILASSYRNAADACDTVANGEATYAVSCILSDDLQHADNLGSLMTAMAGYETERSGLLVCFPGASQTIAGTITDADLAPGRRSFQAKLPRDRLANAIYGSYVEPNDMWGKNAFKPFLNTTYETEDGGERLPVDLDFSMVNSKKQAGRLARIRMREHRRQASGTMNVGIHLLKYEQGDWLTFDSDRWGNRDILLTSITENDDDTLTWEWREIHSSIYSVDVLTDYTPTTDPSEDTVTRTVSGFNVAAGSVTGSSGRLRASLDFTWTAPNDDRVEAIIVRYRPSGETKWYRTRTEDPEDGELSVAKDIIPGTLYEAQAKPIVRQRNTNWTASDTVTTLTRTELIELADDSVEPRKLKARNRPFKTRRLKWSTSGDTVSWSAFTFVYEDSSGNNQTSSISSGSANYVGTDLYIGIVPGATTLGTYSTQASANTAGAVVLAVYSGGDQLDREKGRRETPGPDLRDNDIDSRKLKRRLRPFSVDGLEWVTDLSANTISWNTFTIHWEDDTTGEEAVAITASTSPTVASGRLYVSYIPDGRTTLNLYTSKADARAAGAVVLGVYGRGDVFAPEYGELIKRSRHLASSSVPNAKIVDLHGGKVQASTLTNAEINDVSAVKLTAGILPKARHGTGNIDTIFIAANQISRYYTNADSTGTGAGGSGNWAVSNVDGTSEGANIFTTSSTTGGNMSVSANSGSDGKVIIFFTFRVARNTSGTDYEEVTNSNLFDATVYLKKDGVTDQTRTISMAPAGRLDTTVDSGFVTDATLWSSVASQTVTIVFQDTIPDGDTVGYNIRIARAHTTDKYFDISARQLFAMITDK
jgi:hypothetical protein